MLISFNKESLVHKSTYLLECLIEVIVEVFVGQLGPLRSLVGQQQLLEFALLGLVLLQEPLELGFPGQQELLVRGLVALVVLQLLLDRLLYLMRQLWKVGL